MSFFTTSKDIYLSGSVLHATVSTARNRYETNTSSLDLNQYLANDNGSFTVHGEGWYNSADHAATYLQGATLHTRLRKGNGITTVAATFNLDSCVSNIDGSLTFKKP